MHTGCQLMAKMCHPCENLKNAATGPPNVLNQSILNELHGLKGNPRAPIMSALLDRPNHDKTIYFGQPSFLFTPMSRCLPVSYTRFLLCSNSTSYISLGQVFVKLLHAYDLSMPTGVALVTICFD